MHVHMHVRTHACTHTHTHPHTCEHFHHDRLQPHVKAIIQVTVADSAPDPSCIGLYDDKTEFQNQTDTYDTSSTVTSATPSSAARRLLLPVGPHFTSILISLQSLLLQKPLDVLCALVPHILLRFANQILISPAMASFTDEHGFSCLYVTVSFSCTFCGLISVQETKSKLQFTSANADTILCRKLIQTIYYAGIHEQNCNVHDC